MPERFKVVCIPCKALYKCSALPYLYFEDHVLHLFLLVSSSTAVNGGAIKFQSLIGGR